jgi:hypothetical protein
MPAAGPEHTELATLAACIAHIAGASASDVRSTTTSSVRGLPSADAGS